MIKSINQFLKKYLPTLYKKKIKEDKKQRLWTWKRKEEKGGV